ncbi:hypothetical protein [Azotobacter armeniacus]
MDERLDEMATKSGRICSQFGWTASAHIDCAKKSKVKKKGGKCR